MNNYLEKEFYIIEKDSNKLSMPPNDVKLIMNVIDQPDTDFSCKKQRNFLRRKYHKNVYSEKYAFYLQTRILSG